MGSDCVVWTTGQEANIGPCAVSAAEQESAVDRTLSSAAEAQLLAAQGWRGLDNPWLPEADADVDFSYINLLVNPERYTGYTVRSP